MIRKEKKNCKYILYFNYIYNCLLICIVIFFFFFFLFFKKKKIIKGDIFLFKIMIISGILYKNLYAIKCSYYLKFNSLIFFTAIKLLTI